MSQTQIILIVAALVVIAFFFWRSMREERRMRASRKARLQAGGDVRKDVLAEEKPEPRVEPQLEDMVDDDEDSVSRTFNDYQDQRQLHLTRFQVDERHPWAGKRVRE